MQICNCALSSINILINHVMKSLNSLMLASMITVRFYNRIVQFVQRIVRFAQTTVRSYNRIVQFVQRIVLFAQFGFVQTNISIKKIPIPIFCLYKLFIVIIIIEIFIIIWKKIKCD